MAFTQLQSKTMNIQVMLNGAPRREESPRLKKSFSTRLRMTTSSPWIGPGLEKQPRQEYNYHSLGAGRGQAATLGDPTGSPQACLPGESAFSGPDGLN
jgi:hypothetical protein